MHVTATPPCPPLHHVHTLSSVDFSHSSIAFNLTRMNQWNSHTNQVQVSLSTVFIPLKLLQYKTNRYVSFKPFFRPLQYADFCTVIVCCPTIRACQRPSETHSEPHMVVSLHFLYLLFTHWRYRWRSRPQWSSIVLQHMTCFHRWSSSYVLSMSFSLPLIGIHASHRLLDSSWRFP